MRRENYTKLIPFYTFRFVALFFSIFGIPFILRHSRDFLLKQHLYFSFCPPQIKGKATGKQLDKLPGSYPRQALAVYHP